MAIIITGAIIVGFAFFLGIIGYVVYQMVGFRKWKRENGWYHTWHRS